jgi:hypothetical protein
MEPDKLQAFNLQQKEGKIKRNPETGEYKEAN